MIFRRLNKDVLTRAALAGIVIVAAYLRLNGITRGFWIDEMLSYEIAAQSLGAAWWHVYYPLSYILMHFAVLLGDSESILRLPSYLSGVLAAWLIYFPARKLNGRLSGLAASFLMAVSTFSVQYSQDARFYSILILACVLTLWGVTRYVENPRIDWSGLALFILGTITGSLCHPTFLPFLLVIFFGTMMALFVNSHSKWKWKKLIVLVAGMAAGLLPLASIFVRSRFGNNALKLIADRNVSQKFLLTLPQYFDFIHDILSVWDQGVFFYLGLAIILSSCLLLYRKKKAAFPILASIYLFPLPFFFIPVIHWYWSKYFTCQLPAFLLVEAFLLGEVHRVSFTTIQRFHHKATGAIREKDACAVSSSKKSCEKMAIVTWGLILGIWGYLMIGKAMEHPPWGYGWSTVVNEMESVMTPEDIIVFYWPPTMNPRIQARGMAESGPASLEFYLKRAFPAGRSDLLPTREILTTSSEVLRETTLNNPHSNIWLFQWKTLPADLDVLFQRQATHLGYGEVLALRPAVTVNMVDNGALDHITSETEVHGDCSIREEVVENPHKTIQRQFVRLQASGRSTSASLALKIQLSHSINGVVTSQTKTLDSKWNFILSADLRFQKTQDLFVDRPITVRIRGKNRQNAISSTVIASFYGYDSWKRHSWKINAAIFPDLFDQTDLAVEFSLKGGQGSLDIDNVQFEAGNYPTLFTEHSRSLPGASLKQDQ